MSDDAARSHSADERRIWLAIFGPAVAWILAQQLGFLLASWICRTGDRWVLYLITAAALLVAAAGALAAWESWKRLEGAHGDSSLVRRRFMAAFALLLSAFFFLATLALAIPELVHRPCD
jgi:hypothetical protein